jgi:hypothetical protein
VSACLPACLLCRYGQGACIDHTLVRKTPLFAPFVCNKCIFLPRQAQDKHRENSKMSGVFRRGLPGWCCQSQSSSWMCSHTTRPRASNSSSSGSDSSGGGKPGLLPLVLSTTCSYLNLLHARMHTQQQQQAATNSLIATCCCLGRRGRRRHASQPIQQRHQLPRQRRVHLRHLLFAHEPALR